jgi:hypothetical protein
MNKFLNENWRELLRAVKEPIREILRPIGERILTNIFELVPFDEAFPETV